MFIRQRLVYNRCSFQKRGNSKVKVKAPLDHLYLHMPMRLMKSWAFWTHWEYCHWFRKIVLHLAAFYMRTTDFSVNIIYIRSVSLWHREKHSIYIYIFFFCTGFLLKIPTEQGSDPNLMKCFISNPSAETLLFQFNDF